MRKVITRSQVQFGRQWQERWKLKSEPGEFGPGWYNIDWFTVLELHSESPEAVRKLFMMPYSPEKVNADQGINPSLVALGEWMNSSHWVYLTKASPWMMGGALSIRFDTGKKLWLLEETEGPFQVALSGPGTRQFERAAKVVAKGMRAKKDENCDTAAMDMGRG